MEHQPTRSEYKKVWSALSTTEDQAKLHVIGVTEEAALQTTGEETLRFLQDSVGIGEDDVVLEIGCGIGRVGKVVAPLCRKWIGCDVAPNMLSLAAERLKDLSNVELVEISGYNLSGVADASVDVVYCTVVFMHLESWDRYNYILEAFRVLRPGGRLAVAVGSGAPLLSMSGLAHRLKRLPDLAAGLRGRQLIAPRFLDDLVKKHFADSNAPEETELAKTGHGRAAALGPLVRRAGFERVRSYWQGHRAVFEDPEQYWNIQRTFSSLARKRLADANPTAVDTLKLEFVQTCREVQSRGGKLVYPIAAFFVVARKPMERVPR